MISKLALSETLVAHSDNLRLASVFRLLAREHDLHSAFEAVVIYKYPTGFQPSLQLLKNKKKLIHSIDQLYLTIVRTAVTESFELTRDYCRKSNQIKNLKAQNWYTVFRLIRNALNHNFHFEFSPKDLKELPATWNSITLDARLHEKELTQALLPPSVAIEWLGELDEFISTGLR
jgi:hypothetical protein